jgi:hypothetical protein
MVFEVWDVPTRNLIGTYESVDEEGTSITIADGPALKRLVVHHWPDRAQGV